MSNPLVQQAGSALVWKAIQLTGVKVIFLVRTLILAWLLVPEDFGLLAVSVIGGDFLLSLTNFGMTPALVQRPHADEAQYNAAWTIGVVRAVGISIIVVLAAPFIAALFVEPRATDLIRIVAIRPVLEAVASIKVVELMRDLRFRSLAYIQLSEAGLNTIVSIVLAPYLGVWALVAGILAGPTASGAMSYLLAPHRPRLSFDTSAVRPLIKFGRWVFLTGLIAVSGSFMLQVVISRRLGAAELGLYFLAAKLAFIPAEVSGEVVGAVAFPLYARLQADAHQVARAFRTIFTGISTLLFPICALMIALAPSLVENVLGPRWEGTVPLIRLLALVNVIGFFGDTMVPILMGLGQPYKIVLIEVIQSSLLISLIWTLADAYGVVGAALAWLAAIGSSQLISAVFVQRLLPRPFAGLGGPMLVIATVSGIGAMVALGVASMGTGFVGLIVASLLAFTIMGMLLWVADRYFSFGLTSDLLRVFPQAATFVGYSPADG